MSDFWVQRMSGSLVPHDTESLDALDKLPYGRPLHVEVKQPRNSKFHRLYWALCARIANAIGSTSENISDVLKIATGHVTIVSTKSYGQIHLPKSISFAKMDEGQFREFFERCVVVIYEEWKIEPEMVADLLVPQERV